MNEFNRYEVFWIPKRPSCATAFPDFDTADPSLLQIADKHKRHWPRRSFRMLRSAAYHEAGHAVIGCLTGCGELVRVTIEQQIIHPDGRRQFVDDLPPFETLPLREKYNIVCRTTDSYGHCEWAFNLGDDGPRAVPMWLAGGIAQRMAGHGSNVQTDYQYIRLKRSELQLARKNTTELIIKHWASIEYFAGRLLEEKTINGTEFRFCQVGAK